MTRLVLGVQVPVQGDELDADVVEAKRKLRELLDELDQHERPGSKEVLHVVERMRQWEGVLLMTGHSMKDEGR